MLNSCDQYNEECYIPLRGGGSICVDAYPNDISAIRIVNGGGIEVGYWTIDEVREDPEEVLGAIFGQAKSITEGLRLEVNNAE